MRLFYPLTLSIALKYIFNSKAHKFASFVALLSVLGIMLGVAALIVDVSIMQGMQNNLKKVLLTNTAHVVVKGQKEDLNKLLLIDNVIATAPYLEEQVLMQTPQNLSLINLCGIDTDNLNLKDKVTLESLKLASIPKSNSYTLNATAFIYLNNELSLGSKVRLISTKNARYTPLGFTPSQRIFTLKDYFPSAGSFALAIGNYEDVRRLFRLNSDTLSIRLWLTDPFLVEKVTDVLDEKGYQYTTWKNQQGEFFKAVAMEKLTMGIMLFLVVLVAAFNILSALSMMVSARLNEIAILKTLGFSKGQILKIFLYSGLLVGAIGTLLGCVLGIISTKYAVGAILGGYMQSAISLEVVNIATIALLSLAISLIFTLYPSYKASACDPVSTLCRG